jgi:hypothetical protein
MSSRRISPLIALAILLSLWACSSAALKGSWKDPSVNAGQTRRIVVIGVAKDQLTRNLFEQEMSAAIVKLGGTAEPSYPFISSGTLSSEEEALHLLKQHGADAVLVARVTDQRTETVVTPGYATGYGGGYPAPYASHRYGGWYGHYARSYDVVYSPPQVRDYEVFMIETSLHSLSENRLLWTALVESTAEGDSKKTVGDLVKVLEGALEKDGVF